jgi:outer membrane protein assembly factor BamB
MTRNPGVWVCAVCITGLCLAAGGNLWAQDWPQWRGPNRDGAAPFREPKAWPEKLTVKWKVSAGEGYASPIFASGRILQLRAKETTRSP